MHARSIIHINIADFAVAVERSVDCRLRGRPVIVAPEGAVRATVYDMSDEAYQSGVRKQMALQRALRYCRDAIVLPPHPDRYERATARLFKHAMPYSPLIEMTDCRGHLFIDATGTSRLFGPPPDLAWRLFTKGVSPEAARTQVRIKGDEGLGARVLELVSIMA